MEIRWTIPVGDATTTAIYEPASSSAPATLILGHGAGGNMHGTGMQSLADALRVRGLNIVRFNFLYSERKSRRPDPMPKVQECFARVVEHVKSELGLSDVFIGGRSMGGRAASMMAADGFDCAGLVLFAYPLHPPGQPAKLRDAHLPRITAPVLCFNGTRDTFCTPSLMEQALRTVKADWTMHWIEGADHSFHVLKSSGRTGAMVMEEVASTTEAWVQRVSKRR